MQMLERLLGSTVVCSKQSGQQYFECIGVLGYLQV